ncbi:DUF6510 family protein [Rhodococcus sp. P1Y]|uniref:DUF6510 family protein n=1 Tax=Rhodococcus sp. P1Y TaxID=1302308 RepID=UPI000EAE3006|nr:DUF6510 family protein [Rhodococcus sp. P1Y]AYJ47018.1 hypothetical protein D8W71_00245 [Rhodococcus sp. P1Y]
MTYVDGNALAGVFAATLGIDITVATGRCRGCGNTSELARTHAFITAMGAVMRCSECQAVLAVVVENPGSALVNMSGLAYITVPRA